MLNPSPLPYIKYTSALLFIFYITPQTFEYIKLGSFSFKKPRAHDRDIPTIDRTSLPQYNDHHSLPC